MKTRDHLTIAGVLQLVQGIPNLLYWGGMSIALIILDLKEGPIEWGEAFELWPTLMLALILLCGAIEIGFGIALLQKKNWVTRTGGFICCIPSLWLAFFPPVLAGVYTIWVLVQVRKDDSHNPSLEPSTLGEMGKMNTEERP